MVLRSLKDGDYISVSEEKGVINTLIAIERQRVSGIAEEWELLGSDNSLHMASIDGNSIKILKITDKNFHL